MPIASGNERTGIGLDNALAAPHNLPAAIGATYTQSA